MSVGNLLFSPEVAVEGSQLETVYQCPLKAFFEGFIGLSPNALEKSESISNVAGKAVHRGYQWVSQAHHRNSKKPPQDKPSIERLATRPFERNLALTKLGFYQGPTDGSASPALKLAIAAYQRGQGLQATGQLDPTVTQRLAQVVAQ